MQNNNIVKLTSQGFLKVSGKDAKKLLQGQLTCDLEKITPIQNSLGAHCNPKGRIISFFRLFMREEDYYLQMPKSLIPIALAALQKYAVFYKVSLSDASETLQKIGLKGIPPALTPDLTLIATTESRYEIIGPAESINSLWDTLALSAHVITENTWKHFDILSEIPAIYPDTSEKFLPQELNLLLMNAISFDKGCYTGQEIIARMHYLGKSKSHLYHTQVTLDSPPKPGEEFSKGFVVDCCEVGYNTFEVLFIAALGK